MTESECTHCNNVFTVLDPQYRKIPKYLDIWKISLVILKFEQCGSTIEFKRDQKMQTEWQAV